MRICMKSVALSTVILSSVMAVNCFAATLQFSGLTWEIRPDGQGGPGPNNWASQNAWVDSMGQLHLKLTYVNNKWYCPEVYTTKRLGFGQYWFYVTGRLDTLDQNVVLGLFPYTRPDIGPDGTNEIDIEFSRWGDPAAAPASYTVWPAVKGPRPASVTYTLKQDSLYTTHGFIWNARGVSYKSGYGTDGTYSRPIYAWKFSPSNYTRRVPQKALPVHLNLWLVNGAAPTDGKEVEIVISKFCYVLATGEKNC